MLLFFVVCLFVCLLVLEYHPHCVAPLLAVLTEGSAINDSGEAQQQQVQETPGASESPLSSFARAAQQQQQQQQGSRSSSRRHRTERVILVFQLFGQSDLLDFVEANKPVGLCSLFNKP